MAEQERSKCLPCFNRPPFGRSSNCGDLMVAKVFQRAAKPLRRSNPPAAWRYSVAIASVASAIALASALERQWQSTPFVSLFLCAIILSAWFGGFRPGLLAVALSVLAFDYFFLPPTYSLVPSLNQLPRLVLFAMAAMLVG